VNQVPLEKQIVAQLVKKYSETSINCHSFNCQFLLTVSLYSMYSNQIAAKNHPCFTAERRKRWSGALLFYWWVTFLARLAIAHVECYILNEKTTLSHTEAETMLSKYTEWFEGQEEANATQILLLRKVWNTAAQKARAPKKQENDRLF
jgi:hypothetical protein